MQSNNITKENPINLKEDIWICGLTYIIDTHNAMYGVDSVFYAGKTSEIPEEIAKEILEIDEQISRWEHPNDIFYKDYSGGVSHCDFRDAIQSACNKEFCIVFKKNKRSLWKQCCVNLNREIGC